MVISVEGLFRIESDSMGEVRVPVGAYYGAQTARAVELLGGRVGERLVHSNDQVNLGQSSNDVIPTAIHVAAMEGSEFRLLPALKELQGALAEEMEAFKV